MICRLSLWLYHYKCIFKNIFHLMRLRSCWPLNGIGNVQVFLVLNLTFPKTNCGLISLISVGNSHCLAIDFSVYVCDVVREATLTSSIIIKVQTRSRNGDINVANYMFYIKILSLDTFWDRWSVYLNMGHWPLDLTLDWWQSSNIIFLSLIIFPWWQNHSDPMVGQPKENPK